MRQAREWKSGSVAKCNAGFTLFEMVVVISAIAILYMVAAQRLNDLPAAAERASFQGVLSQMKAALNLQMVSVIAGRGAGQASGMAGMNPMNYMLETPGNYRGELEVVRDDNVERSSWYFETSTREIVYVVGGNNVDQVRVTIAGIPVYLGQIRFRVVSVHDEEAGGDTGRRWQGLVIEPVHPYEWREQEEVPVYL